MIVSLKFLLMEFVLLDLKTQCRKSQKLNRFVVCTKLPTFQSYFLDINCKIIIFQVAGDWWVVKGVNCAQDDVWLGGYDWYPCQHERYLRLEDGGWINNTTYCGGTDSTCTTDQIVTIPHATMPSPGLIRLEYDDEPLLPQIERWHIVSVSSWPEPQFIFVMWCGTNPALDYNGAFVLSRTRTLTGISPETEALFRQVATDHGVSYDDMCVSDNTDCPENP